MISWAVAIVSVVAILTVGVLVGQVIENRHKRKVTEMKYRHEEMKQINQVDLNTDSSQSSDDLTLVYNRNWDLDGTPLVRDYEDFKVGWEQQDK